MESWRTAVRFIAVLVGWSIAGIIVGFGLVALGFGWFWPGAILSLSAFLGLLAALFGLGLAVTWVIDRLGWRVIAVVFGFLIAWFVLFATPLGSIELDRIVLLPALVGLGLAFSEALARLGSRVADELRTRP